jgi:CheY-like chemotaxis protein
MIFEFMEDVRMVVLVVEDNPVSSRFVESVLRGAGYQVLVAQTKTEALRVLATRSDVAILICDIELPDGSGLDLIAEFRLDGIHATLPVIMCTSAGDGESVRAAFAAGCCGYVRKPVNAARLLDRVAACRGAEAAAETDIEMGQDVPVVGTAGL